MSKKNTVDIYPYIRTIFTAIFLGCLFSGAIIYYAQYDVINNASAKYNDKVLNEYIKNIVITQNEDLEAEHPNNYKIDIHLGYLHKVIQEYDKAEKYYKKAVEKAPLNVYKPLYELASFYIERKRYDDADDIINSLPHRSNNILIRYQSSLYKKLGDSYYDDGLYYDSLENYEKALFYWDKQTKPNKKFINKLNKNICDASVNLADIFVNDNKASEAIRFLEKAEKVAPDNFNVKYKIALASANSDPQKSYDYFTRLYKKAPSKIDYVAYHHVIENLAAYYSDNNEPTKAKLYQFRAKQLLKNVSEDLIYPKDIDFKVTGVSLYSANRKSKILIKFNLQNISPLPIKRLNIKVVYKLNGKEIETYTKQLIDNKAVLGIGESMNDYTIMPELFRTYKKDEIQNLTAEIYLYKNKEREICVYNDKLFMARKLNITETTENDSIIDCETYIRFFAEQILNFENSVRMYRENRK